MMDIKIYTKDLVPLSTLISTDTASDYDVLEYKKQVGAHGAASFTMRLDNAKANEINLRHFNIVEILDPITSVVRWCGVIVNKTISLNIVRVECFGYSYVLEKRLTSASHNINTNDNTAITNLLAYTNAISDTLISIDYANFSVAVNQTPKWKTIWSAMKDVATTAGAQLMVMPNRKLRYAPQLGNDLSSSVVFKYDVDLIASSNILSFNVADDGTDIVTKSFGDSKTFNSSQSNTLLNTTYGLLEQYTNFREFNDLATLNEALTRSNTDSKFTPRIEPIPDINDNFDIYDTVKVVLKNKLVNIDQNYQIQSKTVKIENGTKRITVDISNRTDDILYQIKEMKKQIATINQQV